MAFFAALTGLLTGEVGRWVTNGLDEWRAGREHTRKLAEIKMYHENGIELEDVKNFGKGLPDLTAQVVVSDKLNPWVFNTMSVFSVSVEVLIKSVRPLLTAASVAILFYAYETSTAAHKAILSEELVFTSCAVLKYWFGYREDMRKRNK